MIFYGSKSSVIKSGILKNVISPGTDSNTEMNYSIYGKYAHIYWIPVFPMGKTIILEDNTTKSTYYYKDLPEQTKKKFQQEQERNPAKTPITHFSGLIIGVIVIAFATYLSFKGDSDTVEFAKNPKIGDVFYESLANGHFSTSKISAITKDSIFVMQNNKESFEKKDVSSQSAENINFTNPWQFSKKKYTEMVKNGDSIYKIIRE